MQSPSQSVIADRYEVREALGKGQHGEVYRVLDTHLDAEYALKLLESTQIAGPWTEAQLLNTLSGDFILGVRNADTTPEGRRYLVTDIAEHGTVADRIDPVLGVPEEVAVSWTRQACNGLARVHRHGLLHRDVKPENLFITESGSCLVGDLSLAGQQNPHGCAGAGGTLETMAPEVGAVGCPGYQGGVEIYNVRSEVFSLAASLYWMLTGTPPITGSSYCDAASAVPIDLWDLAPHVSRGTRDIVMRSLNRTAAARHPDPASLAAALGRRTKRPREWVRVQACQGHEMCFQGAGKAAAVRLCVVPDDRAITLDVSYRESGRSHPQSGNRATTRTLGRAIRTRIREIG